MIFFDQFRDDLVLILSRVDQRHQMGKCLLFLFLTQLIELGLEKLELIHRVEHIQRKTILVHLSLQNVVSVLSHLSLVSQHLNQLFLFYHGPIHQPSDHLLDLLLVSQFHHILKIISDQFFQNTLLL